MYNKFNINMDLIEKIGERVTTLHYEYEDATEMKEKFSEKLEKVENEIIKTHETEASIKQSEKTIARVMGEINEIKIEIKKYNDELDKLLDMIPKHVKTMKYEYNEILVSHQKKKILVKPALNIAHGNPGTKFELERIDEIDEARLNNLYD